MDNKQFIVELIKYAGWSLVVIISILMIKDKILNLFGGGIKSAKHGDSEIHFFEVSQKIKSSTSINQSIEKLIPIDITGLREELENIIKNELIQVEDENGKVDILIKNLAQAQIANNLDKVYYNIYGSQIQLLEFLSVQENGESNLENIIVFFNNAKTNNPEKLAKIQFSDYINFLMSWDLIQNSESKWIITKRGKAFIKYITAMQYTKEKLL